MPRWEIRDTATRDRILAFDHLPGSFADIAGDDDAIVVFERWTGEIKRRDGDQKIEWLFRVWSWAHQQSPGNKMIEANIASSHDYGVEWPDEVLEGVKREDDDTDERDYSGLVAQAAEYAAGQLASYVEYFVADMDGVRRAARPGLTREQVDMDLVDGINEATMKNLAPMTRQTRDAALIDYVVRDDVLLIGDGHSPSHVTWARDGGKKGQLALGSRGSGLDPGTVLFFGGVPMPDEDVVEAAIRRFSKKKIVFGLDACNNWVAKNL